MRDKKFERITKVRLPFDKRDPDPKKNYGIHGLDIWFILKGKKGAVQFGVTVNVYLPHVNTRPGRGDIGAFSGFDVGYHAMEPQFEGQTAMGNCEICSPCYCDGSSLRAAEWAKEVFSVRGENPEKLIWEKLESEYRDRFGDSE